MGIIEILLGIFESLFWVLMLLAPFGFRPESVVEFLEKGNTNVLET